jgi:hypothetical protein
LYIHLLIIQVVQKVPNTMLRWHAEQSEGSYSLLCRFATLLYTLMSHHLGFPDLYEPVMVALKVILSNIKITYIFNLHAVILYRYIFFNVQFVD